MRQLGLLLIAATDLLAQPAGLPPEWEVRKQLADLVSQTARLQPLVKQIDPAAWSNAPEAYVAQQKSILSQIEDAALVVGSLSRQPERMTVALDVYFRLQTLESQVLSFSDGIRRYQNPAVADLLTSLTNETAASRERLREYVKELVAMREQERDLLEKEAQRCRSLPPRVTPVPKPKPLK
ncbi:MAG: hypothetical protein K2X03_02760 [Bryobacteraceae bacterium]|nr:hypothetical protein [Bryobacteraceae bacterium]